MSSIFSQNNNYSATSSTGLPDVNSAQRLQNDLNLLLNEANESQSGGKWKRKQRGGNAENSEDRLKHDFDLLMDEIRATGSALPAELLQGGKRKKMSSKKGKKLHNQEGGKRKKSSSKKGSKKLHDQEGGKRKKSSSKKGSKKLHNQEGGKRKKSSKKGSKKASRKQSRELPAALVAFQKLVKSIVEGLNITGVRKFAFKLAAEYKKMANGDVDEAIKLFNKEKSSGKAKERYDAIAK
jgi:hypothetical protein